MSTWQYSCIGCVHVSWRPKERGINFFSSYCINKNVLLTTWFTHMTKIWSPSTCSSQWFMLSSQYDAWCMMQDDACIFGVDFMIFTTSQSFSGLRVYEPFFFSCAECFLSAFHNTYHFPLSNCSIQKKRIILLRLGALPLICLSCQILHCDSLILLCVVMVN